MEIEKIPMSVLGAVRQRLGADGDSDTCHDERIGQMSPEKLIALWCGWHMGDEGWGEQIIALYNEMKGD